MGNQVSDLYKVQDLNSLHPNDQPPLHYIWIDLNIKNQENSIHSKTFRDWLELIEVDSQQKLLKEIDKLDSNHLCRIISAASLRQEFYRMLQEHDKVEKVVLFCRTNARSYTLLSNYGKIKQTCNSPGEVIKAFLGWEKSQERGVLFFEEESIRSINQYWANLLSLADKRQIVVNEAKKAFEGFCLKFAKSDKNRLADDLSEYQRARVNDAELWLFMQKRLATDSQITQLVNQLLIATFNPKKLGYLRYLISDIYNLIVNDYKQRYEHQAKEYHSIIRVNEAEMMRLRCMERRYLMFTYFLQASILEEYEIVMGNDILITIQVPERTANRHSNGYVISQGYILFNMGNYFRVEEYNHEEQRLTISLLEFQEQPQIDINSQTDKILLNKVYMSSQQQKYQGQWHAFLLNLSHEISNEYINNKINALMTQRPIKKELIFKYQLNNFKQQLHRDILSEDCQQFLQDLQAHQLRRQQPLAELHILLCEYYWNNRNIDKMEECMNKLFRLEVFIKKDQLWQRYKLLKQAFSVFQAAKEQEFDKIHKFLDEIQKDIKKLCYFLVSENYHLLLKVRARCFEQAKQFDQCLNVIETLIKIYSFCKGRCSHQCRKLLKWKGEILQKRDSLMINQERAKKQKLYTSKIIFSDLKEAATPQKHPINLASISLHFYT